MWTDGERSRRRPYLAAACMAVLPEALRAASSPTVRAWAASRGSVPSRKVESSASVSMRRQNPAGEFRAKLKASYVNLWRLWVCHEPDVTQFGNHYPYMSRDESSPVANEVEREAVLVVDDERPLLGVFAEALGTRFDVSTATSAREAEFLLRKKNFKVVVADHLMPGGNGMSFLVRAREEFPHMQRVLVTGYMKPEMLLRSVNEAALFRYLLKPVSVVELVSVVVEAAKLHDALVKVAADDAS